jgi:threonylcarbamoyladenosine tRNA methylthiotransferase CDKAL1
VWLKTFGCAHNHADGETMAGVLQAQGYRVVMADAEGGDGGSACGDGAGADVWVVNSCTVKTPSQTSVGRLAARARAAGIPLVVSGCVPSADKAAPELVGASLLGTNHTGRVAEVVAHALAGNTVHLLGRGPLPALDLPRIRRNAHVEIVPLSTGCLGRCTYCLTVHARGALGSHPPDAIVARVAAAAADPAVREVWFSSEDTGAYGRDIGTSLPELLASCLAVLPADGRTLLRVGMTNPPYVLDRPGHLASLMGTLAAADGRAFAFLHVPVQSGSDAVLASMRREYSAADFDAVAGAARAAGVTLATDIICGFPGETEADHAATLALLDRWRPPAVHISRFHPRPGTPAAAMPQLSRPLVARRSREVTALVASWGEAAWAHHLGTTQRAWCVSVAADGASTVAHTRDYCQVLLDPAEARPGDVVEVAIESAGRWSVRGRVVAVVFSPPGGAGGGKAAPAGEALGCAPAAGPATPSPMGKRRAAVEEAAAAVGGAAGRQAQARAAPGRPFPAGPALLAAAAAVAAVAALLARVWGVWGGGLRLQAGARVM